MPLNETGARHASIWRYLSGSTASSWKVPPRNTAGGSTWIPQEKVSKCTSMYIEMAASYM